MTNKNTAAERIKKLRHELGFGLREFSRAIKSSPSTICCWEKGKRSPSIEACYRIIDIAKIHGIKITIEWLRPK